MVLQCMWVNCITTIELNGYLSQQGVSSATMAVGYRWILYEYNTWLVSANAEECVIAEKHLTDTIFWQIGSLDPTRPNPTTGQPDPRPALGRAHTHTHTHTHRRYQTYNLPCYAVDSNARNRLTTMLGERLSSLTMSSTVPNPNPNATLSVHCPLMVSA